MISFLHLHQFSNIIPTRQEVMTLDHVSLNWKRFLTFGFTMNLLRNTCRMTVLKNDFKFTMNVFTEFNEFSDKNICHYSKRVRMLPQCKQVHLTGSLNRSQSMIQWFIRFPEFAEFIEFPFHLRKDFRSHIWLKNYNSQSFCVLFNQGFRE